jgi:uncharacterized membrane protein YtjA (UPF0391 family)
MIGWAITFFLMAIVAAMFGFGGLAGTFASIAQLLMVLFVVLFIASLIYGMVTGRDATPPAI